LQSVKSERFDLAFHRVAFAFIDLRASRKSERQKNRGYLSRNHHLISSQDGADKTTSFAGNDCGGTLMIILGSGLEKGGRTFFRGVAQG
jgi:hypothetical protein